MVRNVALCVVAMAMATSASSAQAQDVIYQTDFDTLTIGPIQHHPGAPDQDYWYYIASDPCTGSIGEIQESIANPGRALCEHINHNHGINTQTEDARVFSQVIDVSGAVLITLNCDFYAHTSDTNTSDLFSAHLITGGPPHPGYEIVGFGIASGNGPLKSVRKLDLNFAAFNGTNNNYVFEPAVGRTLEWDTWHSVTVVIDQLSDKYVSLTVNDVTEDISSHPLPRSNDGGVWKRGQLLDAIRGGLLCNGVSDDDVYWDNISLTSECSLKADLTGNCAVNLEDLAIMASEWLIGT